MLAAVRGVRGVVDVRDEMERHKQAGGLQALQGGPSRRMPGSTVENAGIVRFERTPKGGVRLDLRMSYNPPAGAVGGSVARLFGADLKRELDEDLNRFKSVLEGRGKARGARLGKR